MYPVDDKDRVIETGDFPQPCAGAPMPIALANEHRTVLAYLIQERMPIVEMSGERLAGKHDLRRKIALITFDLCLAQMWGPPNDEAFDGHPLAKRGLQVYAISCVENSSWIRQLERMNSVHPRHNPEVFWRKKHFIFAFHDSTFECVCGGFDVRITVGNVVRDTVSEMLELLERK
jgi:hypothetical protein